MTSIKNKCFFCKDEKISYIFMNHHRRIFFCEMCVKDNFDNIFQKYKNGHQCCYCSKSIYLPGRAPYTIIEATSDWIFVDDVTSAGHHQVICSECYKNNINIDLEFMGQVITNYFELPDAAMRLFQEKLWRTSWMANSF